MCKVTNTSGDILYVYSRPDAGGFAHGYMWDGDDRPCFQDVSAFVDGEPYSMCGGSDSRYFAIDFFGQLGFVPITCASMDPPP